MFVLELFDKFTQTKANLDGYRSEDEDHTTLKLSDLRKTKLTLLQLNRLRIMQDTRKLEHEKDLDGIQKQYAAPPSGDAGAPAF